MMPPLPAYRAQSIVVSPRASPAVRHLLLRFADASAGVAVLNALRGHVTTGVGPQAKLRCSLGLTYRGLEVLRLPEEVLGVFQVLAPAFSRGAPRRAVEHLADTGRNAPDQWDGGFDLDALHAIVSWQAGSVSAIECGIAPLRELLAAGRATIVGRYDGAMLPPPASAPQDSMWVHFGYRDGLSRPSIRGLGAPPEQTAPREDECHEAGEFLLGRPDEAGGNRFALPNRPAGLQRLVLDGSFGALRVIAQDVDAFEASVSRWADEIIRARRLQSPDVAQWRDYVKAKLCGRWPDGRRVGVDTDAATPAALPIDAPPAEHYDPAGAGCPFGAHIRRMNPGEQDVVHARRRPLLRRGIPYGGPQDSHRGLLGWFFAASLEDQFEHLLGQWAARLPMGMPGPPDAQDPLIGNQAADNPGFELPRPGGLPPHELRGLAAFCRTRGTAYAFYPSADALALLAADDPRLFGWDPPPGSLP